MGWFCDVHNLGHDKHVCFLTFAYKTFDGRDCLSDLVKILTSQRSEWQLRILSSRMHLLRHYSNQNETTDIDEMQSGVLFY